jgi:hypothetical protein
MLVAVQYDESKLIGSKPAEASCAKTDPCYRRISTIPLHCVPTRLNYEISMGKKLGLLHGSGS